ncbi:SMI1/KNR4 family protein [Saccharopolyspora taberi]|uniref:Knr4/Smi1-like domain-containing protein n=1 Tax=Saccharopolyspora taberi TaxID=60895 RepID=A0ABN3V161_9PSEU
MSRVEQEWQRIEDWLAANARASHAALHPPATAAEIAAAEEVIGFPFPEDLAALLGIHNGARAELWSGAILPGGEMPLSADRIAHDHRRRTRIQLANDSDGYEWWSPSWVPFTANGCGDGMILDRHRAVGWFGHEGDTRLGDWPSLADFLAATADSLENGMPFAHWMPAVNDEGCLVWDI